MRPKCPKCGELMADMTHPWQYGVGTFWCARCNGLRSCSINVAVALACGGTTAAICYFAGIDPNNSEHQGTWASAIASLFALGAIAAVCVLIMNLNAILGRFIEKYLPAKPKKKK